MQKPSAITISQAFELETGASAAFPEASGWSPCPCHLSWMFVSAESQRFDSPPFKLRRCQQFTYYIPLKTCWLFRVWVPLVAEEKLSDQSQGFETLKFSPWPLVVLFRVGVLGRAYFRIPRAGGFPFSAALPHCISAGISLWWSLVSFPFTVAGDHISDPLRNTVSSTLENVPVLSATLLISRALFLDSHSHTRCFSLPVVPPRGRC